MGKVRQFGSFLIKNKGWLFTILASFFIFYKGVQYIYLGISSNSWQPVEAIITQQSKKISSSAESGAANVSVKFAYKYNVDGKWYTSERYHYKTGSRIDSLSLPRKFTAYYDPDDPGKAVVVQGASFLPGIWIVLAVIGIAFGTFMLISNYRDLTSEKR